LTEAENVDQFDQLGRRRKRTRGERERREIKCREREETRPKAP